ncbi:MAG: 5'-Nucleotidase domain protein [Clostridiales bacterium 38_11]|nr:MAG: 5'-Nucleotidase domain protein [Clostridiales bacterium 38_11]HBH13748.1 multifunctional 2',3'-cyclic-nucleotide 2'-phosphodiesterase/5'-nucleotidase/3'-nucleotidase [Clostridiales bacterium]
MKSRRFIVLIVTVVLLTSMMMLPALAATYEVQSGDMLYKIAQKYGVTVQQIVDANDIKNPDLIYPGDKLLIPDGTMEKETVEITILHTNDVHSRVSFSEYDGMGYEKLSTIVKEIRAKNPNTLVMDAGDAFHGQTISTLNKGESIVQIMNTVGYDLMTVGNHDFNYGQDRLLELAEMADFEIISSSILKADYSAFLPSYVIKEFDGVKVAVFALNTPDTTFTTHPNNVVGLHFFDPVIVGRLMVAQLEDKADIIVCLAHLGLGSSGDYSSEKVAMYVDGIDVIVDGHSHTPLPEGKLVNNTLIVQTGDYIKNVGVVELKLSDGVLTKTAKHITKAEGETMESDQAIVDLIAEIQADNTVITSEVIGTTAIKLVGERELVRTGETNLGNLITDAMLYETGAQIAFTNGGGIRSSIEIGDITVGDVITVLPFGNYVVTKEMTGSQIVAALELGMDTYPAQKGSFPHIAGMKVVFDPAKAAGERIVSVTVGGEAIVLDNKYTVATNDFIAAGGDGYTMFKGAPLFGEYLGLDEVLINYIHEFGVEDSEVEGRIMTVEDVSYLYFNLVA